MTADHAWTRATPEEGFGFEHAIALIVHRSSGGTPEQADEARLLLYENGYPLAWVDYLHPCFIIEFTQGYSEAALHDAAVFGGWTP